MNTTPPEVPQESTSPESSLRVPPAAQSNLPLALGAGILAMVVGAAVWAVVTVTSEMQIGWMAVGVGFLVGVAVGRFNPAGEQVFGYLGASLALVGCLLGNLLSLLGFIGAQENISFVQVLTQMDLTLIPAVMMESFSPMDLLFYGIAIYEGFKFAVKQKAV